MPSVEVHEILIRCGMREDRNHYNTYDTIESNGDLESLLDTLASFKDYNGNQVVMTGVNIVANPAFEKIRSSGFTGYHYEAFTDTLRRYPSRDKVLSLWREAIEQRLFVPVFHGREHLNVQRWLRSLKGGHKSTLLGFEYGLTGIQNGIDGEWVPNYQAAFDLDTPGDLPYMREVLQTGLSLFEEIFGYRTAYFVPPNGPFNNALNSVLQGSGIRYVNTAKIQKEPEGDNTYRRHLRFIGQRNVYGQIYLTRNCIFEPSSMEYPADTDWVGRCLNDIACAFQWHKPAIISTHRVNYIGALHPTNRRRGLFALRALLSRMLTRWPTIEFMTSSELGDHIASTMTNNP